MNSPAKSSTSRLDAWLSPSAALDGIAVIDHLFNRMDGLYPNRWRASFANAQAVKNWREAWADGFAAEGVTLEEIKAGLSACRRRFDWPPSFSEFLAACRPPVNPEAAYHEAIAQMRQREKGMDAWSHPAIFWAMRDVGEFDLSSQPWQQIKGRWIAALNAQLEKRAWPEIPPRLDALPKPGKATTTMEEGRKRIAEMVAALQRKVVA